MTKLWMGNDKQEKCHEDSEKRERNITKIKIRRGSQIKWDNWKLIINCI